jgi:hypothetical protein
VENQTEEPEQEPVVEPEKEPAKPEPTAFEKVQGWLLANMNQLTAGLATRFQQALGRVNGALQSSIQRIHAWGQQVVAKTRALMVNLRKQLTMLTQRMFHQHRHWLGLGLSRMNLWIRRLRRNYWGLMRNRYALMRRQTTARIAQVRRQVQQALNRANAFLRSVRSRVKKAIRTAKVRAKQIRKTLHRRHKQSRVWLARVRARALSGRIRTQAHAIKFMQSVRRQMNVRWTRITNVSVKGAQRIGAVVNSLNAAANKVWAQMRAAANAARASVTTGGVWVVNILRTGWNWFAVMGATWLKAMRSVGRGILGLGRAILNLGKKVVKKAVKAVKKVAKKVGKAIKKIGKRFGVSAAARPAAARRLVD